MDPETQFDLESLKYAVLTRFHPETDNFQVLLALVADNFYNLPTREEAECACASAWGELIFKGVCEEVFMEIRFFHCKRGKSIVNDKKEVASCCRQIEWVDVQAPRSTRMLNESKMGQPALKFVRHVRNVVYSDRKLYTVPDSYDPTFCVAAGFMLLAMLFVALFFYYFARIVSSAGAH